LLESNISSLNSSMMPRLLAEARQLEGLVSAVVDLPVPTLGQKWFSNARILVGDGSPQSQRPSPNASVTASLAAAAAAAGAAGGAAITTATGIKRPVSGVHRSSRDPSPLHSPRHHPSQSQDPIEQSMRGSNKADNLKDPSSAFSIQSTFHTLPIFASGSAFVPTAVDTILSNCFFDPMAPLMCERLLCGQKHKTMVQIDLPPCFAGRKFGDLYRAFLSKNLLVLALRRAASILDRSLLPYVYTCPHRGLELKADDRLFVFCSPVELDFAMQNCDGFALTYSNRRRSWISSAAMQAEECYLKSNNKRRTPFAARPNAFDIEISAKFRALRRQEDESEPGSPAGGDDGDGSDCAEEV
jgi:hypothetical protein